MATFGEKLYNLRKNKLGYTQIQLAEAIGFKSAVVISKYESNEREPDFETIKKISVLANVTVDELMSDMPSDVKNSLISAFQEGLKPENFESLKLRCRDLENKINDLTATVALLGKMAHVHPSTSTLTTEEIEAAKHLLSNLPVNKKATSLSGPGAGAVGTGGTQ